MEAKRKLVVAAGGNGTVIEIIDTPLNREDYESRGKLLGDEYEIFGAEQAGFLVLADNHLEMTGGEFCANATRSAAVLLYQKYGTDNMSFTVSGFSDTVRASVNQLTDTTYFVEAVFPGMQAKTKQVKLEDGSPASIVDLGGIVHVVIEGTFPQEEAVYTVLHRRIIDQFSLGDRNAVGVVWYQKLKDSITMHPVVWVRVADTFHYESSCGSGAIAVGRVTNFPSIIQPSGMTISAEIGEDDIVLRSEMEMANWTHNSGVEGLKTQRLHTELVL